MIRAFFLIFEPGVAWARIVQARRGVLFISLFHLVPMLLVVAVVESWGLLTMGKWQPAYQRLRDFHQPGCVGFKAMQSVIIFEAVQFALVLAMVFVAALVIKIISQTFRDGCDFRQAFMVTAYGVSPLLLLRLLDALPMMNPWVPWAMGVTLTIWVLYQGVPCVLRPDPTHAFGLYLASIIVMVLTTGVVRLLMGWYVLGLVDFNHSYFFRKFGHFLGW